MLGPRSLELKTLMVRSGLTFPITCAALPLARWASWRGQLWGDRTADTGWTTYAVNKHSDGTVRVKSGLVSAKLRHLANEENVAADEVVEVRRGDARG